MMYWRIRKARIGCIAEYGIDNPYVPRIFLGFERAFFLSRRRAFAFAQRGGKTKTNHGAIAEV